MIQQKVLIIHGTNDVLLPYQNAELIANKIKHSQVVLLPDVGHMFWLMELEKSANLIISYLKLDSAL